MLMWCSSMINCCHHRVMVMNVAIVVFIAPVQHVTPCPSCWLSNIDNTTVTSQVLFILHAQIMKPKKIFWQIGS